jgi:hypothetical protein
MTAARYVALLCAVFVGVPATTAALNLLVDPYAIGPVRDIPGWNDRKPAEWSHARLRKPLDLAQQSFNAIALGTSQVERGIDPNNPALHQRGIALYNAGLSEERPFEQAILLRAAAATNRVRTALVSLDFLRYADVGGRPEFLPSDWTLWRGRVAALKSFVAGGAILDSARTVLASWRGEPTLQHLPNGLLNVEPLFDEIGQPDYRAAFDAVDGDYLNTIYVSLLKRRGELEGGGFDHAALRDLLATARRR